MKMSEQDKPQLPIHVVELIENFDFPGTKLEIIDYAQDFNPDGEVINILQAIPEREYDSLEDLKNVIGTIEIETATTAPDQNITES